MTVTTIPLRHVADVRVSNVDKKSADGEQPVRLCNYTDVYYNRVITPEMQFMTATATEAQVSRFRLQPGDTIITKDSETADDIAVPTYVRESADDLVCGYHLAVLRPDPDAMHPGFLNWAIASDFCQEQFSVSATGVTRFGLKYESILGVSIPLPSLAEQRRVADFLDDQVSRINKLIELRQRQEQLASEHLNHWLDLRVQQLTQAFGSAPIRRFVRGVEQGGSPLADNIPAEPSCMGVLKTSAIKNGKFVESENKALLDVNHLDSRSIVHQGDVLVVRGSGSGDLVADTAYVDLEPRSTLMLSDLVYRLRQPIVDPEFLTWVLLSRGVRGQIRSLVRQGSGPAKVRAEDIVSVQIPRASTTAQQELASGYAQRRNSVDSTLDQLQAGCLLLVERKRALITATVTGEFDSSTASGRSIA